MFGRLLTPLVAHFDLSPRPDAVSDRPKGSDSVDADAESFARDVLIEVMRNAVEKLKEAEDLPAKLEVRYHNLIMETSNSNGLCYHAWACA